MFARVVSFQWKPDKLDEAIRTYKDAIPEVKQKKGFISVSLLVNRDTSNCTTVAFWETKEEMVATEEDGSMKVLMDRFKEYYTSTPVVERYEVAAQS